MLDQPSQQRTSKIQRNSRLLHQDVFEGPRKSVHRLNSTFLLSVALALALGRCFRHNLGMPNVLDNVTEGNNAWLLIWLEDDSPVLHEVQIGHQSSCKIRVGHTLRRQRVTPDAFTLAILRDEHWKCVMWSVFRLPQRTRNPQRRSVSVLPSSFSCRLSDDQLKESPRPRTHAEHQLRTGKCETLCDSTSALEGDLEEEHASTLLPPEPHPHRHLSDRIRQHARDHFPRRSHQGLLQKVWWGSPVVWAQLDQVRQPFLWTGARSDHLARCHQKFVQLVLNTELQILHVTILKLECRSLEPSSRIFSAFAAMFCSALALQLWTQHPPAKRTQHNHSQSSNRFSLPTQRQQQWHKVFHSLISCLFLDYFSGLPVSWTVPLASADSTSKETCNLLDGFLIRRLSFLTIWPLVKGLQGDHGGSSDRSSGCTPCVSMSRVSAHHRQISGEPLAVLARDSPCLQKRMFLNGLRRSFLWFSRLHASNPTSLLVLRTISKPSVHPSMWETRSPWSCMLKFAMPAQFSFTATCWCQTQKSADRVCPQPNPGSQPNDGNTSKPRHETLTTNLAVCISGLCWNICCWLTQLLTELLELPKHLCHLWSRHTKQSTRLDSQSRVDHNGNPLGSNQDHRNCWINMSVDWCPVRSCCFVSGQWLVDDGRFTCTYPSPKITLKISAHACLRCFKWLNLYTLPEWWRGLCVFASTLEDSNLRTEPGSSQLKTHALSWPRTTFAPMFSELRTVPPSSDMRK